MIEDFSRRELVGAIDGIIGRVKQLPDPHPSQLFPRNVASRLIERLDPELHIDWHRSAAVRRKKFIEHILPLVNQRLRMSAETDFAESVNRTIAEVSAELSVRGAVDPALVLAHAFVTLHSDLARPKNSTEAKYGREKMAAIIPHIIEHFNLCDAIA